MSDQVSTNGYFKRLDLKVSLVLDILESHNVGTSD